MLVAEISKRNPNGASAKHFGMENEEFRAIVNEIENDGLFERGEWYLGGGYHFNGLTYKGRFFWKTATKKKNLGIKGKRPI